MAFTWTDEMLIALEPAKLEQVRLNAQERGEYALSNRCLAIQQTRRPLRNSANPVVGFHFLCRGDYEVTEVNDGKFWSGVWVVGEEHCEPAIRLRGYIALHSSRTALSYRQGQILDWKLEPRTKGKTAMGISFLADPVIPPQRWYGDATGEKGYRRLSDAPGWAPATALVTPAGSGPPRRR